MSLASRLVIGLSLVVVLVMSIYGVTSLRHRERLLGAALARETETLALALQIVANRFLREEQLAGLDRVLERILDDPEVAVSAALDPGGRVIAGGPRNLPVCADRPWSDLSSELHVWTECGGERFRLVVLPLQSPAEAFVLLRRTHVLERDMAASGRRIILTTLALTALASVAILLVLRFALTRPLSGIMAGVRRLGGPLPPQPVPVPGAARELRDLAVAFNEMAERLEGKRRSLIRETEERIGLERRLRRAETFAALGRLTGGVAHELGSPLGVIGMRADAIQADPRAPEGVRRHAEEIGVQVERVAGLIRDLLHVARRHGRAEAPVDLVQVVREVAEELRGEVEAAGVDLQVHAPPRPVEVLGDATLLRNALYNVAANAVQALRGHAGERRLSLALQPAGELARVVIEDTGPGIPAEHYPHVFEPFFTTKDVGEGSGLGLSISAGIVEEHGGVLTLVPAAGGGVRAHIDLPAATTPQETLT